VLRRLLLSFPLLAVSAAASSPLEITTAAVRGTNFIVAEPAVAMVWVKPGTFFMRSPHGAGDDTRVTLTQGYWLGRTEVTQAQWQAIARHIPVYENIPLPSLFKGSERPVEQVSWDMAVLFCAKLSELERGAGRIPPGYEYRLPTEAEWEYACRAGGEDKYAGQLSALGWYEANSGGTTHPVAQKQPNAWGLFDMHGNVNEWCADWYGGYPGGDSTNPTGPASGAYRVLRGGGAMTSAGGCRSALRNFWKSSLANSYLGFRLALAPAHGVAPATVSASP
jgi:formylglycine-generating enzyme required for sulfatase activity